MDTDEATLVPAARHAAMTTATETPPPQPNLNQVAVRQHLDVAAVHAAKRALEKLSVVPQ